jgi:hypothetical protein
MKKKNYIDNKAFLSDLIAYQALRSEENAEKIVKYFQLLASHIQKDLFFNLPDDEEIICDSISDCWIASNKFNPDKSSNPFSYFTRVIQNSFKQAWNRKHRLLDLNEKAIEIAEINLKKELIDAQEED